MEKNEKKNKSLKKEDKDKKNEIQKTENKDKKWKKFAVAFIIIIGIFVVLNIIRVGNENRITINTKSSLEKIIEINKLSTIEYTYNAIVTKYKNDEVKDENIEYYVSYDGKVTAGIDFNEVLIENIDYKAKKIYIKLPEVEIHNTIVDMGTLDYIFAKNVPEKESISQEAYKLCKNDLKERAEKETELLSNATENAKSTIEALIKPWIESIDKEFQIEFK